MKKPTIKPSDGTLNIEGEILQKEKPVITGDETSRTNNYKIKSATTILANKVCIMKQHDLMSNLIISEHLSNFSQIVLGVSISAISPGDEGILVHKGILETTLNGVGKSFGDPVYSTINGDLSFVATDKKIGILLTTTTNAFIFVDIKDSVDDFFALTSITQTENDNSINIATTQYADSAINKFALGRIWTARKSTNSLWYSVTYGNGIFVAVTYTGTNRVMRSIDNGVTWTEHSAAEANDWLSVTYGNGLFVAVSTNGTNRVMTSPDGITWTSRTAAEANQWYSVTYGNGVFVAVASDGTNRVMTSPDGITWTAYAAPGIETWSYVTYGNGIFVALNTGGVTTMRSIDNGQNWTLHTTAETNNWQSVAYGNGTFVAVATTGNNRAMTSPDGITWTARDTFSALPLQGLAYGDGIFVAIGSNGDLGGRVLRSEDNGITWKEYDSPEDNYWRAITFANNMFVAICAGVTQVGNFQTVMTSP